MTTGTVQKRVSASGEKSVANSSHQRSEAKLVRQPDSFESIAKRHRFSKYIVLDIHRRLNDKVQPEVRCTNLDQRMLDDVAVAGGMGNSVLFDCLASTNVPFGWKVAVDCETGDHLYGSPVDDKLVELFRSRDGNSGYCVPVHSLNSQKHVVIYYSEQPTSIERKPELVLETIECFQRAFDAEPQIKGSQRNRLTTGERRCLQWAAQGKTSGEISSILSLSEHTVNHYFTIAAQKLGANGRVHSVAKAMDEGLINMRAQL